MEVRSVEAIMRALNTAEVQYLIVDGLAVNAHGYVRLLAPSTSCCSSIRLTSAAL